MSLTMDAPSTTHDIGPLEQIPKGEGRNFQLGTVKVAVFRNHADEVFATQAECPHLQGPLADGMVGGSTIMCPLHDRMYDMRSGKALVGECDITTYQIQKSPTGTLTIHL